MNTHPIPRFDGDGFTIDPGTWDDDCTRIAAHHDGFDSLNNQQWEVVHAIHGLYDRTGAWPCVHHLCHRLHTDRRHLEGLFGDVREAYRLAGVPNPGEEAKSYL